MTQSSRLKRLVDTQQRLRTLEQLELERCRQALAEAEAARNHVLESVSGAGSADQAWLVARTDAPHRTARDAEAARTRVVDQATRLSDRASVCRLVARLQSEALLREHSRREASELAEAIERIGVSWEDSATQDCSHINAQRFETPTKEIE